MPNPDEPQVHPDEIALQAERWDRVARFLRNEAAEPWDADLSSFIDHAEELAAYWRDQRLRYLEQ